MEITISAKDVAKLRQMTGAGMMDCKKALLESDGDFEKAIEYLRKKGQKLSEKRADRDALEGVVYALVSDDKKTGVVLRLSSETDFVAKNQDFINFAAKIAELALKNNAPDKEALLAMTFDGKISIGEKITEQVGVIGEKIEIVDYGVITAEMVVSYIHMGYRAGVILGLNKHNEAFESAGRDVAMQVAAMKPVALDKDDVSSDVIAKEIEIGKEQAREEGKPEAILEKIALGKLNKFYKEQTLMNQQFVKDNSMDIRAYLQSVDKDLTVTAFKHIMLG
jgi:elongation factor Ts